VLILRRWARNVATIHDENVRGMKARRVECDEIWAFNYCKRVYVAKAKAAPPDAGDAWTWTALDHDSKLIISYMSGDRDARNARNAGVIRNSKCHFLKR
jgi:hypothetical protein